MGEPMRLYGPDGEEVTVYGRGQADVLVAQGFSWTRPQPAAEEAPSVGAPTAPAADDAPPPTGPKRKGRS